MKRKTLILTAATLLTALAACETAPVPREGEGLEASCPNGATSCAEIQEQDQNRTQNRAGQ